MNKRQVFRYLAIFLAIFLAILPLSLMSFSATASDSISSKSGILAKKEVNSKGGIVFKTCSFQGHPLFGKIKIVDSFPDVKVKLVNNLPDLKVKKVSSIATQCGEWKIVQDFPDTRVQFVQNFPDITIKYVQSFPGLN